MTRPGGRIDVLVGVGCTFHPTAIIGQQPIRGYTARETGPQPAGSIGDGTAVGAYAVLYADCFIGERCLIGDGVKVREDVEVGDRVSLHWDVTVNYGARIGDGTTIGGGSHITGGMRIGQRCFFGAGVLTMNDPDPTKGYDADRLNPPVVGDDVLVGSGAILLPGCQVGDGARIGAGAIVDGVVPAGATVVAARGRRVAG